MSAAKIALEALRSDAAAAARAATIFPEGLDRDTFLRLYEDLAGKLPLEDIIGTARAMLD